MNKPSPHGPYQPLIDIASRLVACERDQDGRPVHMVAFMSLLADSKLALGDIERTGPAPLAVS